MEAVTGPTGECAMMPAVTNEQHPATVARNLVLAVLIVGVAAAVGAGIYAGLQLLGAVFGLHYLFLAPGVAWIYLAYQSEHRRGHWVVLVAAMNAWCAHLAVILLVFPWGTPAIVTTGVVVGIAAAAATPLMVHGRRE